MSLTGNSHAVKQYAAAILSRDPAGVLGPWIIAVVMDSTFVGLLLTQVVNYYEWFPRDSPWTRRLVGVVTTISILKWIQTLYITWDKFVNGFGDWVKMVDIGWTFYTSPILSQLLSFCAQLFFAWRCFVLMGRNFYLLVILLATLLTSFSLAVVVGHLYSIDPYNNARIQKFSTPEMTLNVLTDLTISVVVSMKLLKSRSGFSSDTDTALNKLLSVTWGAGVPPTLAALLDMITYLTMERKMWHVLFNMLTCRLYVFSMMYALNSRASIRNMLSQAHGFTSQELSNNPTQGARSFGGTPFKSGAPRGLSGIAIDTETAAYRDSFVVHAYSKGNDGRTVRPELSSEEELTKLPPAAIVV